MLVALVALSPLFVIAQDDTLQHRKTLQEVQITSQQLPSTTSTQTPTQVVSSEQIAHSGAVQLSDVLRQIAGITLKDYGGIGGIKTVSARGLGSQFSLLTIDGVAVSDCQNGQVDLGRYMIGNSAYISFANAQQSMQLLSARAYAAGSVISMETHQPTFFPGQRTNLKATLEGGSFGLLSPAFSWEQRINKRLSFSLWAHHIQSRGDYPFTLYYSSNQQDSSSIERRKNSQMWQHTLDANLFYNPTSTQSLTVKVHYTQSYHALPGPVTFYSIKASEHTQDNLYFVQARYRNLITPKLQLQLLAKYQQGTDIYEDTAARTASHLIHNEYHQQEGYISCVVRHQTTQHLSFSIATDESINTLRSNLSQNSQVRRLSSLNVLSAQYQRQRFSVDGNLLGTFINETTENPSSAQYQRLSPYVGTSLILYHRSDSTQTQLRTLRLRCFFKENYRVPTFNEMYYFSVPRSLTPEKALQSNVGLSFLAGNANQSLETFSATLDAYYNRVSDKIIAVPTQNMFLWSMMNLGRVDCLGLDLKGTATLHKGVFHSDITAHYSYQNATDRTDPDSKSFGHQIPYTPRHSGGLSIWVDNPYVNLGYSLLFVGPRYCMQQNTAANRLPAYTDQGITLSRKFLLRLCTLDLQLQVLNLFDVQYEVVRSYPMMGRNYRIKLTIYN